MSDLSSATPTGASNAAGGTPSESDLPAMQGLDGSVDDPSDPTAPRRAAEEQGLADVGEETTADAESPSDPMPDQSGATGG